MTLLYCAHVDLHRMLSLYVYLSVFLYECICVAHAHVCVCLLKGCEVGYVFLCMLLFQRVWVCVCHCIFLSHALQNTATPQKIAEKSESSFQKEKQKTDASWYLTKNHVYMFAPKETMRDCIILDLA